MQKYLAVLTAAMCMISAQSCTKTDLPEVVEEPTLEETKAKAIIFDQLLCYEEGIDSALIVREGQNRGRAGILLNETATVSPKVYSSAAALEQIVWTSSDSLIASVDTQGVVSGLSAGKAKIKASLKSNPAISNTFEVKVAEQYTDLIEIGGGYLRLGQGDGYGYFRVEMGFIFYNYLKDRTPLVILSSELLDEVGETISHQPEPYVLHFDRYSQMIRYTASNEDNSPKTWSMVFQWGAHTFKIDVPLRAG